jgi:hypothetical protein
LLVAGALASEARVVRQELSQFCGVIHVVRFVVFGWVK